MISGGCLVVGGGGGIGTEVVRLLAAQGYPVAAAGRTRPALAEARCHSLDATDFAATESLVQELASDWGGLRAVVNCAGSLLLKPAHLTGSEELAGVLQANLVTSFSLLRAAARAMQTAGGSVVLVSSAAARIGLANHEAVAAAKAAVEGLTRAAAATYASWGVRVNAVAPGLVDTPLAAAITRRPASLEAARKLHPLGRVGRPEEVARAIAWLVSEEQSWLTGQVLGVDGGLATLRSRG